jgi:hypothetical protein
MPDTSLQARNMRKTVERVDIGVFGTPMRVSNWMKKKKSTWKGWAMMTAAQAVVGGLIGGVACALFGTTTLATVLVVAGFALGSAIGGPLSFLAWSIVLLLLTHLIGGIVAGAWVASPSWWHDLGTRWDAGQPIDGWMKIAVPAWALLWIAAARGMSKLADMAFDKLSLQVGFKAAKNYSGEERTVFDEAFERSDVSQAETRSLLESSGDGTHAVIAGEPSKMGGGVGQGHVREMGGEPDVSSVPLPNAGAGDGIDYDNFLSIGDDPEVMKAVGRKPTGLVAMPQADDEQVFDETPQTPSAVVIEMEPLNLPAVPKDTSPPLQRVEAPKLDPRQNRALFRRMTQLNLAFQSARREDMDAEFIDKHQEELALVSDEQRLILESMNDTGPLLALIHTIQQKRTEEFLVGLAPAPIAPGTGAVEAAPAVEAASDDDVPFDIDPVVRATPAETTETVASIVEETPVSEVETTSTDADEVQDDDMIVVDVHPTEVEEEARPVRQRGDIASMAASLAQALSTRKIPSSTVKEDVGDDAGAVVEADAGERVDVPETVVVDAVVEEVQVGVDVPLETIHAVERTVEADADLDGPSNVTSGPEADSVEAAVVSSDAVAEIDEEVVAGPETEVLAPVGDADAETTNNEGAPEGRDGEDDAAPRDQGSEEEMTGRTFNRSMCRQVLGLVVGPLDAVAKADDVLEFERENTGVKVAEVLNSRSFDEQVGPSDAAAARHAWRDVAAVLSQSSVERLISDFERLNARGQVLVEQSFALTTMSFNAFEADCMRLRRMVSMPSDTDAFEATADLVDRNVAILDSLADIHKSRLEAASNISSSTPGGTVRKRVPSGNEEANATRGRSLIGSVLGGARTSGVGVMREGPTNDVEPADAEVVSGGADDGSAAAAPAIGVDAAPAPSAPAIGEEGFVSRHPIDSIDYKVEMDMHATGLRSRASVTAAESERLESEQRDRDQAERDRVAGIERQREEEERAAREKSEADEARRLAEEADRLRHREDLDRIERDRAQEEQSRARAEAEAAALRLENERAASQRTREDEAILRQFRERQRQMDIPERFRTEVIVSHSLALADLRNIRRLFQTSAIQDKITGLSPVDAALRVPAVRSQLQTDAEMVKDAAAILAAVAALLDAPDAEDVDAIRQMLAEDEVKFFSGVIDQINRGRVARETLDKADEADRRIREQAEKAAHMPDLERTATENAQELERVREELRAAKDRAREAEESAAREKLEGDAARDALEAMRKEQAGIVDDDFQTTLDTQATRLDVVGIDGFYSFLSADRSAMVVVMTTPSTAFPDGTIQRGSKSLTVADLLDFVIARARDIDTDDVAVVFTDAAMRAHINGVQGVTMRHIRRSPEELGTLLSNYSIKLEEPK